MPRQAWTSLQWACALALLPFADAELRALEGTPSVVVQRCTFRIRTPTFNLSAPPPRPGTRYAAAEVAPPTCSSREDATALPHVSLLPDSASQPWGLALTLDVAQKCQASLPTAAEQLLPRAFLGGAWTHFAGDSLLRGQFQTLANWLGKRGQEPWKGEANYQKQFHLTRLYCCRDFASASVPGAADCSYSLHEKSTELFAEARRHRADGRACLSYAFLMEYDDILSQLRLLTGNGSEPGSSAMGMPSRLIMSAGVHPMKHLGASGFRSQVDTTLRYLATEDAWAGTVVSIHGIASPNYTAIAAGHYAQTVDRVTSFNEQLRSAIAGSIARDGWRPHRSLPRFLDLYAITQNSPRRFPMLDSLHYSDMYYQTVFVADALVLAAAACSLHDTDK